MKQKLLIIDFALLLKAIKKSLADIGSAGFTGLACLGFVSVFFNSQDLIEY